MEEYNLAQQLGGQPIIIMKEGTQRSRDRDAQSLNIMAAKAVADAVRTTLGPKGMDKMLVDSGGDVITDADWYTISLMAGQTVILSVPHGQPFYANLLLSGPGDGRFEAR